MSCNAHQPSGVDNTTLKDDLSLLAMETTQNLANTHIFVIGSNKDRTIPLSENRTEMLINTLPPER